MSVADISMILSRHEGRPGALLPILHDVQHAMGHVAPELVPVIAEALNLSRAEVHGVISFYHDFRTAPANKPIIKLCRAEACQARGVEALVPQFENDGRIEVDTVYCLGLCASGPAAMVGDRVIARLDKGSIARLIEEVA